MANPKTTPPSRLKKVSASLSFRHLPEYEEDYAETLESFGYYLGFPCPLGHRIRDKQDHWCYRCVARIRNNICGFDINYVCGAYNYEANRLWKRINVKKITECWPIKSDLRIGFPSYRNEFNESHRRLDKVNVSKAVYSLVWGDVGNLRVTHSCDDHHCGNPLHLVCSWNRTKVPKDLHYFNLNYDPTVLMTQYQREQKGFELEPLISKRYKQTIAHPKDVSNLE